ncbi:MAG: nucleoside kinase [Bacillota bacterium]
MISVTLDQGQVIQVESGTSLQELSKGMNVKYPIVAAAVNNEFKDLLFKVHEPARIKFYDLTSQLGLSVYVRSLSFLFIRAAREVLPNCRVMVEHSLAKGLYCEIKGGHLTGSLVKEIEQRMKEIVDADEPFEKIRISKEEALEIFERDGQLDKVKMLKFLPHPEGNIYKFGWLYDFFYGYLVPSTGYLKVFALQFHLPGVIIQFPMPENPEVIPKYVPQPKLAQIFFEAERWAEILGVNTVADLNEFIVEGNLPLLVKIAEGLHEKKVANIADEISAHKDRGNIILISGPSSSGKTTFAERLKIQLMVNGLKPVSISVDNYFVDREKTPRDEYGEFDFEALEAIDLDLFNDHLTKLIQGYEIELPIFNFITGRRELSGHRIRIKPDQPIIIEGIHGLNEKMTYSIPKDHKFKVYASCLTQLNIDDHNRIPTTDVRKIRRIVRDHKYRGYSALYTIKIWPSVRRGEEKNIFPFQEDADIMFNSALIYELAVLKPFAEPLLKEIGPENEEYIEAQRLLRFLSYFLPVDSKEIPANSIIKEFIG